jgi:hypothetical protein
MQVMADFVVEALADCHIPEELKPEKHPRIRLDDVVDHQFDPWLLATPRRMVKATALVSVVFPAGYATGPAPADGGRITQHDRSQPADVFRLQG